MFRQILTQVLGGDWQVVIGPYRAGWSNLESHERKGNARARLVINVPVRERGGPGGEETETEEQQEKVNEKRGADPTANAFRRRSVKMCSHLGRITCSTPSCATSTCSSTKRMCDRKRWPDYSPTTRRTTRTPESCPQPLSRRLSLSSQVSSKRVSCACSFYVFKPSFAHCHR